MVIIWKKEIARIHQGQISLEGDSYKHLTFHCGLERKIPFGSSCLAPIYVEMDNKTPRIKVDFLDLFYGNLRLDNKRYIRIGHQKRTHKTNNRFVIYLRKWFREKYCIPGEGEKDYFLPKIELQEDAIYLYVIGHVCTETKETK